MFKHNIKQVLVALDQLVYCICGTFLSIFNHKIEVYADMTVSAQAYRLAEKGYWYGKFAQSVINCLFMDKNHCKDSYTQELTRAHLPPDVHKDS